MRDPSRIDPFLSEIKQFWHKNQDWRFGQVVTNVVKMRRRDLIVPELFYIEDDKFLIALHDLEEVIKSDRK